MGLEQERKNEIIEAVYQLEAATQIIQEAKALLEKNGIDLLSYIWDCRDSPCALIYNGIKTVAEAIGAKTFITKNSEDYDKEFCSSDNVIVFQLRSRN